MPSSIVDDSPPVLIINWLDELRRTQPSAKP